MAQVKPNPEVYKYALKQLAVSASEAVAVEDTKANQSAANLCDIDCYLFPGEYATVNYEDMAGNNFMSESLELSQVLS